MMDLSRLRATFRKLMAEDQVSEDVDTEDLLELQAAVVDLERQGIRATKSVDDGLPHYYFTSHGKATGVSLSVGQMGFIFVSPGEHQFGMKQCREATAKVAELVGQQKLQKVAEAAPPGKVAMATFGWGSKTVKDWVRALAQTPEAADIAEEGLKRNVRSVYDGVMKSEGRGWTIFFEDEAAADRVFERLTGEKIWIVETDEGPVKIGNHQTHDEKGSLIHISIGGDDDRGHFISVRTENYWHEKRPKPSWIREDENDTTRHATTEEAFDELVRHIGDILEKPPNQNPREKYIKPTINGVRLDNIKLKWVTDIAANLGFSPSSVSTLLWSKICFDGSVMIRQIHVGKKIAVIITKLKKDA